MTEAPLDVPLDVLSKQLVEHEIRATPATLARWANHGKRGVRLDALRAGRRLLSSVAAVKEFCRGVHEAERGAALVQLMPDHTNSIRICEEAGL